MHVYTHTHTHTFFFTPFFSSRSYLCKVSRTDDHYVWLHIFQTLRRSSQAGSRFGGGNGEGFWEGSPKQDDEVATSWPRPATDLHIVHRWTSIAALCFGMPAESEERKPPSLSHRSRSLTSTLVIASRSRRRCYPPSHQRRSRWLWEKASG